MSPKNVIRINKGFAGRQQNRKNGVAKLQQLPKELTLRPMEKQEHSWNTIYVLGSKLPLFPYNRGWSSTQ